MKLRQLPRIQVDSLRAPKVRRQLADAERQRGEHDVLGREETRVVEKALEDEDLERQKERRPPRSALERPSLVPRRRSFRLILRVGAAGRAVPCVGRRVCVEVDVTHVSRDSLESTQTAEIPRPRGPRPGLVRTPRARRAARSPSRSTARSGLAVDQVGLAPNNSGHPRAERLAPPRPRRGTYREHYTGQAPALRRRPWTRPESQRLFPPTYGLGSPRSAPADHSQRQRRRSEALECGHPSLWGDAEGCRELAPDQERFEPGTSGV